MILLCSQDDEWWQFFICQCLADDFEHHFTVFCAIRHAALVICFKNLSKQSPDHLLEIKQKEDNFLKLSSTIQFYAHPLLLCDNYRITEVPVANEVFVGPYDCLIRWFTNAASLAGNCYAIKLQYNGNCKTVIIVYEITHIDFNYYITHIYFWLLNGN